MNYVEGCVCAVEESKKEDFIAYAQKCAPYFKEHGALRVVECWGDDVPDGKLTSFPMAVKKEENETVVFSWIEWPSREVREEAHKHLYQKMEQDGLAQMPFDGARMIFGGFQIVMDV